ncbi:M24 family metallopeptidase C-terminal domain-containing protein [Hallella bergensis]|uniref:M24 family metallopeptidase C-terminal domain-containing protein n=1 Tax=Hallella bergensis TaxID=242750 RepID=UPI003990A103
MSRFLQFDSLTLCPIDAVTIIREELLQEHIDWLNAYHEGVFDELAPYHDDDEITWLKLCTNIFNIILQSPPSIFSIILLYL